MLICLVESFIQHFSNAFYSFNSYSKYFQNNKDFGKYNKVLSEMQSQKRGGCLVVDKSVIDADLKGR